MSSSVGIIGLGIMGGAIARNLMADGYAVWGYDIDPDACKAFEKAGGHLAKSPADVSREAMVVLTSLPSAKALEGVVSGPGGLVSSQEQDRVVVELSTLRIEEKDMARQALEAVGMDMMDAPISGTGKQVITRDISVYISGSESGYQTCKPVLEKMARTHHFVGPFGNGSRMKFVANLLVSIHNVAAAEALVLGMKSGLEPQTILDVIGDGAGTSRMFEVRGPVMVEQSYTDAGMKMDVWQKDLDIIGEFARTAKTKTPVFDASARLYREALAAGFEKQDTAVVCQLLEHWAGLRRSPSVD